MGVRVDEGWMRGRLGVDGGFQRGGVRSSSEEVSFGSTMRGDERGDDEVLMKGCGKGVEGCGCCSSDSGGLYVRECVYLRCMLYLLILL